MNTKVMTGAALVALGVIIAIIGYLRLHSMAGPARNVAPGFADNAMVLVGVGAGIGLIGTVFTVYWALRERA